MTLQPHLVQLQGRVLPEEKIVQGGQSVSYQRRTSDWSRETRSLKLNVPMALNTWAIIFPQVEWKKMLQWFIGDSYCVKL